MAAHPADDRWMALALGLGRRGLGRTWPNPAVGCVIVKDGVVLGRGWTQPGGRPHAETMALAQAGAASRGATAYVTLEPCAHHGKTPPCAAALRDAGISRLVSALQDPDPRVAGKGHAMLADAGVQLTIGPGAREAAEDHAGFLLTRREHRPLVTLKLATSFDGRIATATGESQWITGPEARRHVHALRARHDAVMVGAGTARADDPALTVRGFGDIVQPLRIVTDSRLSTDPKGQLGRTAAEVPVWLCHGDQAPDERRRAWQATGAELVACAVDPASGRLDINHLLRALADKGLTRIFCEGGGQLAASMLAARTVDQLITFTAGLVLGAGGTPSVAALPVQSLAAIERFKLIETRPIGGDAMLVWRKEMPV